MQLRCYSEVNPNYRFYGGAGIRVCQRWRDSFLAFFEDMGRVPSPKHTLDRIETTGNYEPGNCRWATKEVQSRNQKSNRFYTANGLTMILKDWARHVDIPYITLWNRLNVGIPFEKAIAIGRYDRAAITEAKRQLTEGQPPHRE